MATGNYYLLSFMTQKSYWIVFLWLILDGLPLSSINLNLITPVHEAIEKYADVNLFIIILPKNVALLCSITCTFKSSYHTCGCWKLLLPCTICSLTESSKIVHVGGATLNLRVWGSFYTPPFMFYIFRCSQLFEVLASSQYHLNRYPRNFISFKRNGLLNLYKY